MHKCEDKLQGQSGFYASYQAGPAITYCKEDTHGFLWAGNGEYETMVNYCPFCGKKARRPAVDDKEWEKILVDERKYDAKT